MGLTDETHSTVVPSLSCRGAVSGRAGRGRRLGGVDVGSGAERGCLLLFFLREALQRRMTTLLKSASPQLSSQKGSKDVKGDTTWSWLQ